MPHDVKGRLVEAGDVVKGRGYNVKHEIVGPVVSVSPGASTCNVQVAYAAAHKVVGGLCGNGYVVSHPGGHVLVQACVEYGQADHFEIIQKADGSIPVDAPQADVQPVRESVPPAGEANAGSPTP